LVFDEVLSDGDRAFVNDYPHFRKACLGYSRSFGLFAKHR
jgi:hypothetical protein